MLYPPAVLDIDGYSVPLNDVSLLVAQRWGSNHEPAILSVSPPQTHFILRGFPSGQVSEPLFHDTWQVFGMNYVRPLFKCLLERKARIFQAALIDEINGAIRLKGPDHRGECVDDEPNAIFGSFQLFDVGGYSIPISNVSPFVSQLDGANSE